jgi:hypothetical protein
VLEGGRDAAVVVAAMLLQVMMVVCWGETCTCWWCFWHAGDQTGCAHSYVFGFLAVQAFRKAIGVRIKEETEIIEGEVRGPGLRTAHTVNSSSVSCARWLDSS